MVVTSCACALGLSGALVLATDHGASAAVVSAIAAAIAAALALWTALLNRTLVRAATDPELGAINLVRDDHHRYLEVTNGGGGLASYVEVVWVVDGRMVSGNVRAFLKAGDHISLAASLNPAEELDGPAVLVCRGARGDRHGQSLDGARKIVRRRPWKREPTLDVHAFFAEAYPAVTLEGLPSAKYEVRAKASELWAGQPHIPPYVADAPAEGEPGD